MIAEIGRAKGTRVDGETMDCNPLIEMVAAGEPGAIEILADWCEERGDRQEAYRGVPLRTLDIYSFGILEKGSGSGYGYGYGSGSGLNHLEGVLQMEIGKAYLVHCSDGHTFCGRVIAQKSAYIYVMDTVSKIRDTKNGDNWEKLAAGDKAARKAADYRHYTTPATIPLTVCAFLWEGPLPQEA